jgi:hypothetical protein
MGVHFCNPSYLGSRDGRIKVPGQPRQKLVRTYLKNKSSMVVYTCGPGCLGSRDNRIKV